jgi:hypothetical protein
VEKVNPIKLYEENKVIAGFSLLNLLFKQGRSGLIRGVVEKLIGLYNQKKIKPVVDSLWALEEVSKQPFEFASRSFEQSFSKPFLFLQILFETKVLEQVSRPTSDITIQRCHIPSSHSRNTPLNNKKTITHTHTHTPKISHHFK